MRSDKLDYVFNKFLKTKHHLFVVQNGTGTTTGVIALEDVVEAIIRTEIVDEHDIHENLRRVAKQRLPKNK